MRSDRLLGTGLIAVGLVLGALLLLWLAVNAVAGVLAPGGFVLGLFLLALFVVPLLLVGAYVLRRGAEEAVSASAFERRRTLLERDRLFRQVLQREVRRALQLVSARAAEAQGEAAASLRRAQQTLEGLADEASQPVREADWLHAASLGPQDVRDVERYDDLLLAGIRRIEETAVQEAEATRPETARLLEELSHSAARQFDLRQDLVLRGRRLPSVAPLHLLRAEIPGRRPVAPENLGPGGAVSHGEQDYLVTAHVTYFMAGRDRHALVLRGQEGERRLLVEPGADRALLLDPVPSERLRGGAVESGTASASIDSLSGRAEGVVVDYRRTREEGGQVGWWERWPEGERGFLGTEERLSDFEFWPAAVGSE
ncbi:MAG: hypothetical protein ACM3US_07050 [Sphingomonadaceae bacterium]